MGERRAGGGAAVAALAAAAMLAGCGAHATGLAAATEFSPYHHGRHNAIVRVVTRRRLVALTFDDGPSARYTPRVLADLRRGHAHATFFVIGRAALTNAALVRAEIRAGHDVGDHTFDHPRLPSLSAPRVAWELNAGARAIERAGAPAPAYSRPPWGDFDERVAAIAAAQGRPLIGWDLALDKALHAVDPSADVRALVARVRPGSIILAHDGGGRRDTTIAALPHLLDLLHARGFRVVSVSALLAAARPPAGSL